MKINTLRGTFVFLFIYFTSPVYSQVIITEIFADPSPSHGLPEKEFLELFNAGSKPLALKGYVLHYANSRSTFTDGEILPGEYVILCRKGNEADFLSYGKVVTLSSFSLLNEGALLILRNDKGEDVFSVRYAYAWYAQGKDQGYSLEMIDKNYACRGKDNWTSSIASQGATPGRQNSVSAVLPDVNGPFILDQDLEERFLTLGFNEKLNAGKAISKANFTPNDRSIQVAGISFDPYNPEYLKIEFNRPLLDNEAFELLIQDVEDCSGNMMEPETRLVGHFSAPDSSQILLSEVLFNPRAGGYDFVELYNNSNKTINLKGWFLAKRGPGGTIEDLSLLRNKDLILLPGSYLAVTENKAVLGSQYPESPPANIIEIPFLPSLPVTAGTVLLLDNAQKIYEEFTYSEQMHHPLLDDRKGVSLERISYNVAASSIDNWGSSSYFTHFSTPGYKNSQTGTNLSPTNIFYAEPLVFFPYSNGEDSKTSLKYSLAEAGMILSVKVLNSRGMLVRNLQNNVLSATEGAILWDGTDNSGVILPVGYYLFYVEVGSGTSYETHLVKTVSGAY